MSTKAFLMNSNLSLSKEEENVLIPLCTMFEKYDISVILEIIRRKNCNLEECIDELLTLPEPKEEELEQEEIALEIPLKVDEVVELPETIEINEEDFPSTPKEEPIPIEVVNKQDMKKKKLEEKLQRRAHKFLLKKQKKEGRDFKKFTDVDSIEEQEREELKIGNQFRVKSKPIPIPIPEPFKIQSFQVPEPEHLPQHPIVDSEKEELKKQLELLKAKHSADIEELKSQHAAHLDKELEPHRKWVMTSMHSMQDFKNQIEKLKSENEKLLDDNSLLNDKNSTLTQENQAMEEQLQVKRKFTTQTMQILSENKKQIEKLTSENVALVAENKRIEDEKKNGMKWIIEQMESLKTQCKEKDIEIAQLNEEIENFQVKLAESRKNENKLENLILHSKEVLLEGVYTFSKNIGSATGRTWSKLKVEAKSIKDNFQNETEEFKILEKMKEFANTLKREINQIFQVQKSKFIKSKEEVKSAPIQLSEQEEQVVSENELENELETESDSSSSDSDEEEEEMSEEEKEQIHNAKLASLQEYVIGN